MGAPTLIASFGQGSTQASHAVQSLLIRSAKVISSGLSISGPAHASAGF